MSDNLFNAQRLSLKEVREMMSCKESLLNKRLNLSSADRDRHYFYKSYVSLLRHLSLSGIADYKTELCKHFDLYFKEEWYPFRVAYDAAKEKEEKLAIRFFDFFISRGFKILETNMPFSFDFSRIDWINIRFSKISDKADFVVDDNGTIRVIKVVRSMPYSSRARKDENKPINAPELIGLKAGFIEKYPNCSVELWSICSSADKGMDLTDKFSFVSENFTGYNSKAALIGKLFESMSIVVAQKNCSDCIYSKFCAIQSKLRVEDERTAQTTSKDIELRFTEVQEQVNNHVNGPMCVIAVPGAGKTACLVERCVRMIKNENIAARNILLLSFTKKACSELVSRLQNRLGDDIPKVLTLNSFGNDILIKNAGLLGHRAKLASDTTCKALIEQIFDSLPRIKGVSYEGMYSKYGIISSLFSWFKEIDLIGENAFIENHGNKDVENIIAAHKIYKDSYAAKNYISYDDQIKLALDLLNRFPKVSAMMSKIYRYIMVDEYQDVNEEQALLIDTIAKHHNNLVVVGDDDQSIYGWRGSSNKFMLNFAERFDNTKTVTMSDNFRSTEQILSTCQLLISKNNGNRFEKTFVSHRTGINPPCVMRNFVKSHLPGVILQAEKAGFKRGDIAIIGRKNKTLSDISDDLAASGIASTSPKDYLVSDALFLAIKDVLTLAYKSVEDISLYRLLTLNGVPKHFLFNDNEYYDRTLYEQLLDTDMIFSLEPSVAADASWNNFIPSTSDYLQMEYGNIIKQAGAHIYNAIKVAALRRITSALPKIAAAIFGNGTENHPALLELINLADERGIADTHALLDFMNDMEKFSDEDRVSYSVNDNTVNLLTAHDSKGKEFPLVIVYGLEDYDDDEESTRLLFVAMSRAKKSLFVTEGPYATSKLLPYIKERMIVR